MIRPPVPADGGSVNLSGTARFYIEKGEAYFRETIDVDMSAIYDRFLKYLEPGSRILDAGSGSGRDTLEFLRRGYVVEAFDASDTLVALSYRLTGVRTQVLRFEDFHSDRKFAGIWSCAALLHVPRPALTDAMSRLFSALEPRGVLYASFKLGNTDHTGSDGRHFTDMDEYGLKQIVGRAVPKVLIAEIWTTAGESDFMGRGAWLNAILQRSAI
jgi:SAM-dependent methyltransferase